MSENLSKIKRDSLLESLQEINQTVLNSNPELAGKLREIYTEIENKKYVLMILIKCTKITLK